MSKNHPNFPPKITALIAVAALGTVALGHKGTGSHDRLQAIPAETGVDFGPNQIPADSAMTGKTVPAVPHTVDHEKIMPKTDTNMWAAGVPGQTGNRTRPGVLDLVTDQFMLGDQTYLLTGKTGLDWPSYGDNTYPAGVVGEGPGTPDKMGTAPAKAGEMPKVDQG